MEYDSLLLTDLYQLTMLHGYHEAGMEGEAVFDFFIRDLRDRNFLVAAGLEQVLELVENARFSEEELEWLSDSGLFPQDFVNHLGQWRFHGDIHAMPEGTVFFPDEPIVRVTAPISEAQLLETRVVNLLHLQVLLASKAVRCSLAAPAHLLVDFGLRRSHGFEAGLFAARASYLAGFRGTSTVLAGKRYGIPVYGTMAHSYIQAHETETDAFTTFSRAEPGNVTLLIDTYDTEAGAEKVVAVAQKLREEGIVVGAVRLDSGDLGEHAHRVRRILDKHNLEKVKIFASGSLDEFTLQTLIAERAPIDGFGVGTRMDTAADHPYLDCAYKLTEYDGIPRLKRSEGKRTWPGRKQVFRRYDERGIMSGDELTLESSPTEGEPLLRKVMENGERIVPAEPLETARQRLRDQLHALPPRLLRLAQADDLYPVVIGDRLKKLTKKADSRIDRMLRTERLHTG